MRTLFFVILCCLLPFGAWGHDVDDLSVLTPLGTVANFTSTHFGYTLALTHEEERHREFRCFEEGLPKNVDQKYSSYIACKGYVRGSNLQVWVGWKKSNYQKLELAQALGVNIIKQNSLGPGIIHCQSDDSYTKKLYGTRMTISDCGVVIDDALPYQFSILFLYPKHFPGVSQWIAVVSSRNTTHDERVNIKKELLFFAGHLR